MPYLQGRLERVNEPALRVVTDQPELQYPFSHYLRMLYYDSVTYHPEALDYFYRLMGADHLLFGSDHPFGQPYSGTLSSQPSPPTDGKAPAPQIVRILPGIISEFRGKSCAKYWGFICLRKLSLSTSHVPGNESDIIATRC